MKTTIPLAMGSLLILTAGASLAGADQLRVSAVAGSLQPAEGGPTPAAPSPLKEPFGVDFDAQGGMWIVELGGARVHRLESSGALGLVAGKEGAVGYAGDGGPAKAALFNGMHNVAVHRRGEVYIADTWNHCVRRLDPKSGTIETIAGTGKAGFGGDGGPAKAALFDYVMCVTLDAAGERLYLADINNRRIRVIDLARGTVDTVAGNGRKGVPPDGAAAKESPLVDPRAVDIDSQGTVYVLERGGHALRAVGADGRVRTVAGNGEAGALDGKGVAARLNSPKHLCHDAKGRIWIADEGNNAIRRYDPRDGSLATALGGGHGAARLVLSRPHGVCVAGAALYVVDSGHDRVLKVEGLDL